MLFMLAYVSVSLVCGVCVVSVVQAAAVSLCRSDTEYSHAIPPISPIFRLTQNGSPHACTRAAQVHAAEAEGSSDVKFLVVKTHVEAQDDSAAEAALYGSVKYGPSTIVQGELLEYSQTAGREAPSSKTSPSTSYGAVGGEDTYLVDFQVPYVGAIPAHWLGPCPNDR